ncbi:MAG: hypothetical protein FWC50_08040 [Planctomycetaceae bacterium]|nr:hypothetical protein [Planctomycetaceae bacterium]
MTRESVFPTGKRTHPLEISIGDSMTFHIVASDIETAILLRDLDDCFSVKQFPLSTEGWSQGVLKHCISNRWIFFQTVVYGFFSLPSLIPTAKSSIGEGLHGEESCKKGR